MVQFLNYLYIAVAVILLFGAAIFVHEFGHYWLARLRGLKVLEFSIGFGPKIFGWNRNGIDYSVRWIPAGGYVKLPQMVTSSTIEGENEETKNIPPASPFSKILVAAAGPFMNVVFAFAIASILYFVGVPVPINPSIIGPVEANSPEAKAGIQEGDKIVAVNGKPVKSWQEVHSITILALTNVLPVSIERDGKVTTYQLATVTNNLMGFKVLNLDPRDRLVLKNVSAHSPAEAGHLQPKDEIVAFAGVPVTSREQFISMVQKRGDMETPVAVKRGDQSLTLKVTPSMDSSSKKGRIGVEFEVKDYYQVEYPTPWAQVTSVWDQMVGTFSALVHSRQSGVKASDLSGPVGIIGGLAVQVNTDYRLALNFLVLLNINLGLLNLLPIPVLDGGHIIMSIIERIRRRPLSARFVEYLTTGFAIALISFMLYVTVYDIKRISILRTLFNRETQIEQTTKPAQPATNPNP